MLGNHTLSNGTLEADSALVEIFLVSKQGFWLLADNEELFLSYTDFPWFKNATIEQITQVEHPSKEHLYWPSLDVDLTLESVRNPSLFPLVSKPQNH